MTTSVLYGIPVERPHPAALRAAAPPVPQAQEERTRRLLNVAVAVAALIVALPLMAVIAALIKLTSRGPVLFTQTRVGLDRRRGSRATYPHDWGGAPFTIYKFRTMAALRANNEQVWARPNDDRITRVGRVLRRYRLDELPQLWNVLRGDMNIVGPRPEQPAIFKRLRDAIPEYPARQRVRPGITGLAQIRLAYDQTVEDVRRKLALDLQYLRQTGVLQDLHIMLCTPAVMLGRRLGW